MTSALDAVAVVVVVSIISICGRQTFAIIHGGSRRFAPRRVQHKNTMDSRIGLEPELANFGSWCVYGRRAIVQCKRAAGGAQGRAVSETRWHAAEQQRAAIVRARVHLGSFAHGPSAVVREERLHRRCAKR